MAAIRNYLPTPERGADVNGFNCAVVMAGAPVNVNLAVPASAKWARIVIIGSGAWVVQAGAPAVVPVATDATGVSPILVSTTLETWLHVAGETTIGFLGGANQVAGVTFFDGP